MYSLRAWTKSLGYKHPSFLSQCLRRERNLNAQFIKRLFEREKFTKEDKQYISFLYLLHCAQDINDLELDHLFRYHDIDMPISVLL